MKSLHTISNDLYRKAGVIAVDVAAGVPRTFNSHVAPVFLVQIFSVIKSLKVFL